jgi:hypothetical protein
MHRSAFRRSFILFLVSILSSSRLLLSQKEDSLRDVSFLYLLRQEDSWGMFYVRRAL